MVGIVGTLTCSSGRSDDSQRTFADTDARALYSASVDDLATTFCLKDFQEMGLPP
jgi:hypothetical protein